MLSAAGLVFLVINLTKRCENSGINGQFLAFCLDRINGVIIGNTYFISSFSSLLNIFHDQ